MGTFGLCLLGISAGKGEYFRETTRFLYSPGHVYKHGQPQRSPEALMMQRDGLPFRTLLQVAAQRGPRAAGQCRLVIDLLSTASAVHAALRRGSAEPRLADLDFEILISLWALDPEPATPAMLATHAAVTRSAITDALDRLEARELVRRRRAEADRRSLTVHLTETGAQVAQQCVVRFVEQATQLATHLPEGADASLAAICTRLSRAALRQQAPSA